MNSETRSTLEEYAKRAGVVVMCPRCHSNEILASDPEAESMAYGMATNGWKHGEFRADSREEIMSLMKEVLSGANIRCPFCP
jgi:hypothetical protein